MPFGLPFWEIVGPLANIPAVIVPRAPSGAIAEGICASPRGDLTSFEWRWGAAVCATSGIVAAATACLDGQAGPGGNEWDASFNQTWRVGQYRTAAGLERYQIVEAHCYPSGFPENPLAPRFAPAANPWAPPLSLPSPIRDAILGRGWPQGRDVGYDVYGDLVSPYHPTVQIGVRTDSAGRTRVDSRTRNNPRGRANPNPRPEPETPKERKNKTQRAAALFWSMLATMSEARDVIQAVHQGVPGRIRRGTGRSDTFGQLGDIVQNFDKIDWGDAAMAVGLNEIEDRIIGGLHGRIRRGPWGDQAQQLDWLDSYAHEHAGRDEWIEQTRRQHERE